MSLTVSKYNNLISDDHCINAQKLQREHTGCCYSAGEGLNDTIGECLERIKNFMKNFFSGFVEGSITYAQIVLYNFYKGLGLTIGVLTGGLLFMAIFKRYAAPL